MRKESKSFTTAATLKPISTRSNAGANAKVNASAKESAAIARTEKVSIVRH